jgi:hypothetical protein
MSSTPPTSPQHHQAAARQAERDSRVMGSPDQRRIPAAPPTSVVPAPMPPSTSVVPAPVPPSASTSTTVDGQTYHHLPPALAAMAAALNTTSVIPRRRGRTPAAIAVVPSTVSFYFIYLIDIIYSNSFRLLTVLNLLHLPQMQVLWLSLLLSLLFYHKMFEVL